MKKTSVKELRLKIEQLAKTVKVLHEENDKLTRDLDISRKYADELVNHKDMVCLPADLRNLRKANLDFAEEIVALKIELDEANDYILKVNSTLDELRKYRLNN